MIGTVKALCFDLEFAVLHQTIQESGVVLRLHIKTEIVVILAQSIKTVRAGGNNLFDAIPFDGLNVLGCHALVHILIAHFAHRLTTALLFLAEDTDADAGSSAEFYETGGYLDVPLVK